MTKTAPAAPAAPVRRYYLRAAGPARSAAAEEESDDDERHPSLATGRVVRVRKDGNCLFTAFRRATGDAVATRKWLAAQIREHVDPARLAPWGVEHKGRLASFVARSGAFRSDMGDVVLALLCACRGIDVTVMDRATGRSTSHDAAALRASFGLPASASPAAAAPHALLLGDEHYDVYEAAA